MSGKRIYIAYTGGTIGMREGPHGYEPAAGFFEEQMRLMPELRGPGMPSFEVVEYEPLLDSADMSPDDWLRIARDVEANYADYDGFVVVHGTDTMAYTASALSFMLEGLGKPVVLTGSQIPLCETRNDARNNLITALEVAANHAVPEVTLCFGDALMRGCRVRKVDASGLAAFASPNFPPLGQIGSRIEVDESRVRRGRADEPLRVQAIGGPHVGALRLFPGLRASVLENMLSAPLQGLVLEAFGIGNGPKHDQQFLDVLRAGCERGIVVVVVTQCLRGKVDLSGYATGEALASAGVTSGLDMTPEAALAKLHYLLNRGLAPDEIRAQIGIDLRGELTP